MVISTRELMATYGETPVLQNISLEIGGGQILAMIGRNGAGKSTLFKALCGLVKPARGSIYFDGQDITRWPTHKILAQGVSYMPQGAVLFDRLSVEENIRVVNARGRSYDQAFETTRGYFLACLDQRESVLMRLLDSLLGARKGQLAGTLSGGQRQVICLARSLLSDPKVLLWDEPSIGLSPSILPELATLMRHLAGKGKTILLIDQKIEWVLNSAQEAVVMRKGEIAYRGSPGRLLEDRPLLLMLMGLDNRQDGA